MSFFKRLVIKNVGNTDRIIRVIPFLIFTYVYYTGLLSGTSLIILGVVSIALLFTSITGLCSIYAMFGISTSKNQP